MSVPVRQYFNKFNRGEIDTLSEARDDITKITNSGSLMCNFMPIRLGPMMLRPGTEYLGAVADASASYTIPFISSTTDTALLEFTDNLMRVWVSDALLTTSTVDTTIANGTFTSNLTSWTDADESGSTSAFLTGGYMALTGTGATSAVRWQTTGSWDGSPAEHRVRIIIKDAPVLVEIGNTAAAAHTKDIFSGILSPGTHSLVFTPTDDIDITFSNSTKQRALVDSVVFETAATFSLPTTIAEANLSSIRYSQSADVVFIAFSSGQQFKIERRGIKSWSIVDFKPTDGPWGFVNTSDLTLKAGALSGSTTLTANKGYFNSNDIGSIFQLVSQGQEVTASLTAEDTGTDSIRVTGVGASRIFIITATGTWTATLTLQRSTDDSTWTDVENYTTNQSKNYDDGFDNSLLYYRLHCKTGNFTSGTIVASLEYEGGSIEGVGLVTGYTSTTVVSINTFVAFGRTAATRNWYRGEWNTTSDGTSGYPTAVALYEGRLWWGGRSKAWGSVSDAFSSYDDDLLGDSAAIPKTIGFGPVDNIEWLMPLNRLLMGIASDELSIRSNSFGDVLTPSNANIKRGSSQGAGTVDSVTINNRGYFAQRSLKKLYELNYDFNQDFHDSADLTVLNPDILSAGIKRLAVTMQPEVRVYVVLDDGTARVLLLDKSEEVAAWSRIETGGTGDTITDVTVLPSTTEDRVYFTVLRENGHYLEKLALFSEAAGGSISKHTDSSKTYVSPGSSTLTGLNHLEGEVVHVWADGAYEGTYTVSSNQITVGGTYTNVVVGLRYTGDWTSSKLGNGQFSTLTYDKRVVNTGFILEDYWPDGLTVGPDSSTLAAFPDIEDGKSVVLTATLSAYDQRPFPFDGTMTTDPRIHLQAVNPVTIKAMSYGLDESNDPKPKKDE